MTRFQIVTKTRFDMYRYIQDFLNAKFIHVIFSSTMDLKA